MNNKKRPTFKKKKQPNAYANPEELFGNLPNRAQSHGYLRAPQVDALREYSKLLKTDDVALELPTGTGKTAVGLVIAEWNKRKYGKRVAFLSLTNQLAKQVLAEAEALGISCADLRGGKHTRNQVEVGRYQTGEAIGVTTYSNLFNVNPVIKESDLLVFDDSHGGESYVSGMWTVKISANAHSNIYQEALSIIRPALSDVQYRVVSDESRFKTVELADVHSLPEQLQLLTKLLDSVSDAEIRFPWSVIRNNLNACLFFISFTSVTIRPIVPPTHTHPQFAETRQKIFMSATLGGSGDLKRAYGIKNLKSIHAQNPQWGSRYIFIPGLYLDDVSVNKLLYDLWSGLKQRRLLSLAPSFATEERLRLEQFGAFQPTPTILAADDIEDSLTSFTSTDNVVLSLAGRYDGIDLPGDDCRLLLLAETPGAIGALEQHQKEHWKLGPLLRRRERTRLIQGMGRCTRDATDYAVIVLIGQSLVDSLTNPAVVQGLPGEIQRELEWGLEQVKVAADEMESLAEMLLGLLNDSDYRKEANEALGDWQVPLVVTEPESFGKLAREEVSYSQALWSGNSSTAYEISREAADKISDSQLSGYRAWWLYLAAHAASIHADKKAELDCLQRARATGINAGFIDNLLRKRASGYAVELSSDLLDEQVEAIWNVIDRYGWAGQKFGTHLAAMRENLSLLAEPSKYHIGLETLGELIGAETIRSTASGAPDVVWIFPGQCFTIEAKSDKMEQSRLNKKDVQQAVGHPDWLVSERPELSSVSMQAIIISPSSRLTQEAMPHVGALKYLSTEEVMTLADQVVKSLKSIRVEFSGKEFASVAKEFKTSLAQEKLLLDSFEENLEVSMSSKS